MEGQFPCGAHSVVCESDMGIYYLQPEKTHSVLLREVTGAEKSVPGNGRGVSVGCYRGKVSSPDE